MYEPMTHIDLPVLYFQSFNKPVAEKPTSTVSEAEWNAVHQAKEIKRDELDRFERETKRLVAEQKARRIKLQVGLAKDCTRLPQN